LVRHHKRWAHDFDNVRPLEELIPEKTPKDGQHEVISREISRIMPSVRDVLYNAGVGTEVTREHQEPAFAEGRYKEQSIKENYDLIIDYFDFPYDKSANFYRHLMHVIEQGIGVYQDKMKGALVDIVSPVVWIVWVVRLPVWILNRAGVQDSNKLYSLTMKALPYLMLVTLLLLAAKLGFSVKWGDFQFLR